MSFSKKDIAGMLKEYEEDYHTGMDIDKMAGLLHEYTSGYPFLVSRLCQLMDENVGAGSGDVRRKAAWTREGFFEALRMILTEKNTLFESLIGKLYDYPELSRMLRAMLFAGRTFSYNVERILEKFVVHFNDIYGNCNEKFLEEEGRKYFLLYLRPIINGEGNYYVESRTRELRRTDVIVDYHGEQFIIEMKIWHGEGYNRKGEQQPAAYLEEYHADRGCLLSFNFNKKKRIGVRDYVIEGKKIVEATV